jgi:hypothetical protein
MARCFALIAFTTVLLPGIAYAQEGCPEGDWFCEPAEHAAEPAESAAPAEPAPEEADPPPPAPAKSQKPVPVIVVDRPENKPRPPRRRFFKEWGFNLHLGGGLIGSDRHEADSDAEMGGVGLGLRYRPRPHLAFDASAEFIGGIDFNGYERDERALLLNAIVFFNPWSKFQVYGLGGIGFAGAEVRIAPREGEASFEPFMQKYTYFGGQLGIGAEGRISRRVAIGGDLIGFIRGRTDDDADEQPEFVEPGTGRPRSPAVSRSAKHFQISETKIPGLLRRPGISVFTIGSY